MGSILQFIANGPDIPDSLLMAQEEGRVVFFCGAGISYPAGLPDFAGLVEKVYEKLGAIPDALENDALKSWRYDMALGLLERRMADKREGVRRAIASVLDPDLSKPGATDTHMALLELATQRDNSLRLVTTNFDRVFERIIEQHGLPSRSFEAPRLPIPKQSRWDGLVYLHGLLPNTPDPSSLNRLVVTSGDFGLAYLTERWASRFVSELFRQYVVCFVGYSINDPVLRYMVDALAADRLLGESTPDAYAFGACKPAHEARQRDEWSAKGVTPILFSPSNGYAALHQTLKSWAETWRDGVNGKERIVVDHAIARPSSSTKEDDFVGRMMWALSDKSALPAKRFAEHNPAPHLEWLESLSQTRFDRSDLARFGIVLDKDDKNSYKFSVLDRPTPPSHAPMMSLATEIRRPGFCDATMHQLGLWLVRHLGDRRLLHWVIESGSSLHADFISQIDRHLKEIDRRSDQGDETWRANLLENSPQAIPSPSIRKIWNLFLRNRVKHQRFSTRISDWTSDLKQSGLCASLRIELREILSPVVELSLPYSFTEDPVDNSEFALDHIVRWEVTLAKDIPEALKKPGQDALLSIVLPELVDDFSLALKDALDLFKELGGAEAEERSSLHDLPSISEHWQNRGFEQWVQLIILVRNAWEALLKAREHEARALAMSWFSKPYLTFKRLALHAATFPNVVSPEVWVGWLTGEEARWVWDTGAQREALRLLAIQGGYLPRAELRRLEKVILKGPALAELEPHVDAEHLTTIREHAKWLRLKKLDGANAKLSTESKDMLADISQKYPYLTLHHDEREEFPNWSHGTGDPGFHLEETVEVVPEHLEDLVQWLLKPPKTHPFYRSNWRDVCQKNLSISAAALMRVAKLGHWPIHHWRTALQAWSEPAYSASAWDASVSTVLKMPDAVLLELSPYISRWLQEEAKQQDPDSRYLIRLAERIFGLPLKVQSGVTSGDGTPLDEPVFEAINHPAGHVAQGLITRMFKHEPSDNDGLPADIKRIFTFLSDTKVAKFKHARVILAANVLPLYRIDRPWTEKHLLPLFNWKSRSLEARRAWDGFLWSPRLYRPLMAAMKPDFLKTARHFDRLGKRANQYATFLTYVALEQLDQYELQDFRAAFGALPAAGLATCGRALQQSLDGASERREEHWRNRIKPLWKGAWPKDAQRVTPLLSGHLARLAVSAGSEFPDALDTVKGWLVHGNHNDLVIDNLKEPGLSDKFPDEALRLLNAIVSDDPWPVFGLRTCLIRIATADPKLIGTIAYKRLDGIARRFE